MINMQQLMTCATIDCYKTKVYLSLEANLGLRVGIYIFSARNKMYGWVGRERLEVEPIENSNEEINR